MQPYYIPHKFHFQLNIVWWWNYNVSYFSKWNSLSQKYTAVFLSKKIYISVLKQACNYKCKCIICIFAWTMHNFVTLKLWLMLQKKEIKYYITYIYIYGRAFKLILKKYLPLLWFFVCISNSICYKSLHIASSKTWSFSLIIYRVAMQGFFKV